MIGSTLVRHCRVMAQNFQSLKRKMHELKSIVVEM